MRTYGALKFQPTDGGFWLIDAEPHVHMRAKRIFGKISKQQAGRLYLSDSFESCRDLEWFLDRYPLKMADADRERLVAGATLHRDNTRRLEELIDPNYQPPTFALALPARSYQAREAAVYLANGALLIGDDVGLGKTAAAICSFTDPKTLPACVVTLAGTMPRQWADEIRKFAPDLNVHILKRGQPYELPKFMGHGPDVVILNYHKLAGWAKVLGAYCQSIVFDEVQELRHRGSEKYNSAECVRESVKFALGLSATPIYNYGGEIFSVLNLLKPGCLGTHGEFLNEWCGAVDSRGKSRLKDPKAFGTWAREQFLLIRHTRREVGRELPDVIRVPHRVEADTAALDRIENTAAQLAKLILAEGEKVRGAKWQASEQLSTLLRQATGIAKAPYVADFVRLLLESGEKVVLAGWHREVYDIWKAKLAEFKPVMFTGSESPTQKDAAVKAFLTGQTPVFMLSLRSGVGIDGLQKVCSCVVFGELDWSPGVHEQVIGRLNRDGQPNPVVAYFLVADDGADPAIVEALGIKRQQVEGIRNPTTDFLEKLETDGARTKRLATLFLQQRRIDAKEDVSAEQLADGLSRAMEAQV